MTPIKTPLRLAALAAIPAAALLAEAMPGIAHQSAEPEMPLTCEIVKRATGTGVQLEGHVHADADLSGRYAMNITQAGGGGSSVIRQSGDFSVAAGRSATLGKARFGGDPGEYDVELTLSWGGRTVVCRSASEATDL
jgi:hypothetical protein